MDTWFDTLLDWFLKAMLVVLMVVLTLMTVAFVAESIHDYQHECSCVRGHYHKELIFNPALKMATQQNVWHCEETKCLN